MSTHVTVPDPPVPPEALVAAVRPRPEVRFDEVHQLWAMDPDLTAAVMSGKRGSAVLVIEQVRVLGEG